MTKHLIRITAVLAVSAFLLLSAWAQESTPIPVQLATSTPLPLLGGGNQQAATPTPTPTETPIGPTQLEATSGSVNVRADSDPEAEIYGIIIPGERYAITGRYFRWLQFRFPNSPTGLGWVFDELVTIHGDPLLIPDLSVAPPTPDPLISGPTLTVEAILNVPGGELTATAGARIIEGPVAVIGSSSQPLESQLNPEGAERLPTFTPAPNVDLLVASSNVQPTNTSEPMLIDLTTRGGSFPPILPIVALIGLGVLGLAFSFWRR